MTDLGHGWKRRWSHGFYPGQSGRFLDLIATSLFWITEFLGKVAIDRDPNGSDLRGEKNSGLRSFCTLRSSPLPW